MSGVAWLAEIYRDVTGLETVPKLLANLGCLDDLALLVACSEPVLRRAAESLGGRPGFGFPVVEWGRAVERLKTLDGAGPGSVRVAIASGLPVGAPRPVRRMLEEVGGYVDVSMVRLAGQVAPELLAEGRRRILERVLTAEFRLGPLARRRSRWARVPSGPVGMPPVVEADAAEESLVHLLALTWPEAQFSYTPRYNGAVFAGWNHGYHRRDDERVYVTGLSDVLDSVNEVVQDHRDGAGGRVFVRDGRVACAECRRVIAWVGSARGQDPVPPVHVRARPAAPW